MSFLAFCIVLHPIVKRISLEVPELLVNGWFCDDGVEVGRMEDLVRVVHIILEDGPPRGLVLSTRATCPRGKEPKSTIWGQEQNSDSSSIERHVQRIQDSGFVLLGSPIGSHQFEAGKIEERIEAVRQITAHLPLIKDPQSEFVLLRSCFSLPKMMYLLRTINPSQHQALLATFDTVIRDSITQILGVGVNDQQWSQVQLPVTMGGLGPAVQLTIRPQPMLLRSSLLSR